MPAMLPSKCPTDLFLKGGTKSRWREPDKTFKGSTCCIRPFNSLLMITLGETGADGETRIRGRKNGGWSQRGRGGGEGGNSKQTKQSRQMYSGTMMCKIHNVCLIISECTFGFQQLNFRNAKCDNGIMQLTAQDYLVNILLETSTKEHCEGAR